MTSEQEGRRLIVEICRRMYDRGLVTGTDGNVSVKLSSRYILTTPSGVNKGYLSAEQLVLTDMRGAPIRGKGKPSSEIRMHVAVYEERPDVEAIIHAHPPLAVAFSLAGQSLAKCILPEVILSLGDIPISRYATPTTADVPLVVRELIRTRDAIILDRHGSLTVGPNLFVAYDRLETVEHCAKITLAAKQLGQINPLPKGEVDRLIALSGRLGLSRAFDACQECGACGREPGQEGREMDQLAQRIEAQIRARWDGTK